MTELSETQRRHIKETYMAEPVEHKHLYFQNVHFDWVCACDHHAPLDLDPFTSPECLPALETVECPRCHAIVAERMPIHICQPKGT